VGRWLLSKPLIHGCRHAAAVTQRLASRVIYTQQLSVAAQARPLAFCSVMAPTVTKDFGFLPIPAGLRYDPEKPAKFGFVLNAGFGLASTFVGETSSTFLLL
jgi:hypothetical protein